MAHSRLTRLLGFLKHDPDNLPLLADAATAAFDEGERDAAAELLDRYAALAPLSPQMLNLKGLVAIGRERFEEAVEVFSELLVDSPLDPALRFNLGWSLSVMGDFEGAFNALDDATAQALASAATLKVQALHHLGRLEEALALGQVLATVHGGDAGLMGALALVAMDAEDTDLARLYAERAGGRHEGLSTLGMLSLDSGDVDQSLQLFEQSLASYPDSARGLLGMGLGLMAKGQSNSAAPYIDRSAEIFGDHLGSWVAAGWAYFVAGDYATSRARFETALALDDTFAETHGALAVLDLIDDQLDSARKRTEVALRLDRKCLAGALAKSLILMREGDQASAERIQAMALNMPIGKSGATIAQAAVRMGMSGPKSR